MRIGYWDLTRKESNRLRKCQKFLDGLVMQSGEQGIPSSSLRFCTTTSKLFPPPLIRNAPSDAPPLVLQFAIDPASLPTHRLSRAGMNRSAGKLQRPTAVVRWLSQYTRYASRQLGASTAQRIERFL